MSSTSTTGTGAGTGIGPTPSGTSAAPHDEYEYHPLSQWKEPWSNARLTLFDLHRVPRPIQYNKHLQLPLEKLDFSCPICLGYMRKTSVIMECLHRFCNECIQKCLRIGKKECPSCRIHIPSRRSLRADPKFDLLIHYICGDLDVLEQSEMQEVERYKESHKVTSENRKRGILQQASQRRGFKPKSGVAVTLADDPVPGAEDVDVEQAPTEPEVTPERPPRPVLEPLVMEPTPLVELELRKHPSESRVARLSREYLRLNGEATIGLLKGFLAKKLSYANRKDFIITLRTQGGVLALDDSLILASVRNDMSEDALMILQYRLSK